jgi:enediyne biosynthesis protein E4
MNHVYDSITFDHSYDPSCLPNMFFVNKNGKGFEDQTSRFNMANEGCGLAAVFTDYDRDGDLDLMLLNDFGEWNGLGNLFYYRNEFPLDSFTEISREIGFYREMYGMGIGPGDYDRDGDLDYYITNIGQNYLLNNSGGKFTDAAEKLGLSSKMVNDSLYSTSWSGLFFDYDNDGELDLYLNKGNVLAVTPKTAILDPNKLFINKAGKFSDVSAGSGIDDPLSHRGAALLDFDHDGDLDLVSAVLKLPWSEYGNYDQKIKFYRNLNRSKNNWIGIKLQGSGKTNRSCLGCGLLADTGNGILYKEVESGSGHASQSTKIQYFGLGKNKRLNSLKIFWLGESPTEIKNLKANKVYEIGRDGIIKIVY